LQVPVGFVTLTRQPENVDAGVRDGALREQWGVDFHDAMIVKKSA
jgi:hypothetical protein